MSCGPAAVGAVVGVAELELVHGAVAEVVGVLAVVVEERVQRPAAGCGPPARQVGVDPDRHDRRLAAPAQHLRHQRRAPHVPGLVDDPGLARAPSIV